MDSFKYSDYIKNKTKEKNNIENILKKYILLNNIEYNKQNNLQEEKIDYKIFDKEEISYQEKQKEDIYNSILLNKNKLVSLINKAFNYKITVDKMEYYNKNFLAEILENNKQDIFYKIKDKDIFFIIEHQYNIDYSMPLRLLEYCMLIMENVIDKKRLKNKNYQLPIIYPIVIYTGNEKWDNIRFLENYKKNTPENQFTKYNIIDMNVIIENN